MAAARSAWRTVGRWMAGTFVSLITLLCLTVVSVMIWPGLLINGKTLAWAARYLQGRNIYVSWSAASVDVRSKSFWRKRGDFRFTGLCVRALDADAWGCVKEIEIAGEVGLAGWSPEVVALGPVHLERADVQVGLGSSAVRIRGDFTGEEKQGKLIARTGAEVKLGGKGGTRIAVNVSALTGARPLKELFAIQFAGNAWLNIGTVRRSLLASGKIAGNWSEGKFEGDLQASMARPVDVLTTATMRNCHFSFLTQTGLQTRPRKGSPGEAHAASQPAEGVGRLALDCALGGRLKLPAISAAPTVRLPTDFGLRLKGDFLTAAPPSINAPIDGTISLQFSPIATDLASATVSVDGRVAGVVSELPKNWKADGTLKVAVRIPEFATVVQALKDTDLAVPAPLNVLRGEVRVGVSGDWTPEGGTFPVAATTRLSGQGQKLDIDASGTVAFTQATDGSGLRTRLDASATLSDVQLALPRLDFKAPPPVIPDSRIESASPSGAKKEEPAFRFRLVLKTPDGRPADIFANLARAPVPVQLQLTLSSDQPVEGWLRVDPFPLRAFRRDAVLESLAVRFPGNPALAQTVDGSLRVEYTDYTVLVSLRGDLDKPEIHLSSTPPLPEEQLIAVLMFGRPIDELPSGEGESVGNTRAALADGAVGLTSFLLLASTPVESVSYDPQSQAFAAKLRIAEGTSLNIGSEAGAPKIGVRRRISRYWTVTTDYTRPPGAGSAETGVLSAFLEWSSRY